MDFEVEGQRKKKRLKYMDKAGGGRMQKGWLG